METAIWGRGIAEGAYRRPAGRRRLVAPAVAHAEDAQLLGEAGSCGGSRQTLRQEAKGRPPAFGVGGLGQSPRQGVPQTGGQRRQAELSSSSWAR